jgi:hypothetical protein
VRLAASIVAPAGSGAMGAACEIPETAVAIEAATVKMAVRNDMGFPSRFSQLPVVKPHAKAKTVQNCSCE